MGTPRRADRRACPEGWLVLLRQRGVHLSGIARELGKDLSVVSRVNNGHRRSRMIEREIARRLDLPLSEAFPEWYEPASGARDVIASVMQI